VIQYYCVRVVAAKVVVIKNCSYLLPPSAFHAYLVKNRTAFVHDKISFEVIAIPREIFRLLAIFCG
jgi:hypothetical protein